MDLSGIDRIGSFHDAEIVGLWNDRAADVLSLQMVSARGIGFHVRFTGVLTWALTPYARQNSVFDVAQLQSEEDVSDAIEELNLGATAAGLIRDGKLKCWFIDSSCGMGGYIVAQSGAVEI